MLLDLGRKIDISYPDKLTGLFLIKCQYDALFFLMNYPVNWYIVC